MTRSLSALSLIRRWRERRHPFTRRLGIRGAREYIALSPAFSDVLRQRAQDLHRRAA